MFLWAGVISVSEMRLNRFVSIHPPHPLHLLPSFRAYFLLPMYQDVYIFIMPCAAYTSIKTFSLSFFICSVILYLFFIYRREFFLNLFFSNYYFIFTCTFICYFFNLQFIFSFSIYLLFEFFFIHFPICSFNPQLLFCILYKSFHSPIVLSFSISYFILQ